MPICKRGDGSIKNDKSFLSLKSIKSIKSIKNKTPKDIESKEKTYRRILLCILGACLALTAAHIIYAVYAYRHCSIIYFIGKELW